MPLLFSNRLSQLLNPLRCTTTARSLRNATLATQNAHGLFQSAELATSATSNSKTKKQICYAHKKCRWTSFDAAQKSHFQKAQLQNEVRNKFLSTLLENSPLVKRQSPNKRRGLRTGWLQCSKTGIQSGLSTTRFKKHCKSTKRRCLKFKAFYVLYYYSENEKIYNM